jgi:hypothetical protein
MGGENKLNGRKEDIVTEFCPEIPKRRNFF